MWYEMEECVPRDSIAASLVLEWLTSAVAEAAILPGFVALTFYGPITGVEWGS
jgi:hypothetical protein